MVSHDWMWHHLILTFIIAYICFCACLSGALVQQLSLLYNFIRQCLNSGSAQVQVLLAASRRFVMMRISHMAANKAKRLLSVNHTTKAIHHHNYHHHHLLITSDLLFYMLSSLCRAIASFSLRHRKHHLEFCLYENCLLIWYSNIRLIVLYKFGIWYCWMFFMVRISPWMPFH